MSAVVNLAEVRLRRAVNQDFDQLIGFLRTHTNNQVIGVFYEALIELHMRMREEFQDIHAAMACWRISESHALMPTFLCESIEWVSRDDPNLRVQFMSVVTRFDTGGRTPRTVPEYIRNFTDEYADWMTHTHHRYEHYHAFSKIPMMLFSVFAGYGFALTHFEFNHGTGQMSFIVQRDHHSADISFNYAALIEESIRQKNPE